MFIKLVPGAITVNYKAIFCFVFVDSASEVKQILSIDTVSWSDAKHKSEQH